MGTRNTATLSAQRKRYRMRHGERVRARIQAWRKDHTEYQNEYRTANRDELNAARRARYATDEGYRTSIQGRNEWDRAYWRSRAFAAIGRQSCPCGCSDLRILDVNHLDGTPKDPLARSGLRLWKAIATGKLNPSDFDLRCRICNFAEYLQRAVPGLAGTCTVKWDIPFSLELLREPVFATGRGA